MKKFFRLCLLLLCLVFFQEILFSRIVDYSICRKLQEHMEETEEFRQMKISPDNWKKIQKFSQEEALDFSECLAALMVEYDFSLDRKINFSAGRLKRNLSLYQEKKPDAFKDLAAAYKKIIWDLVYFPVAAPSGEEEFFFENGYGTPRHYGGKRTHEGIDIFGKKDESGYYPVISISAGVVEQVGWLPLGGYRVGIRSPEGCYFYYAHLSSYGKNFRVGDRIYPGEFLGLMGDTGYGPEGTSGRFPVHLHLGIYIEDRNKEEMSINPYSLLVLLENQIQQYQY